MGSPMTRAASEEAHVHAVSFARCDRWLRLDVRSAVTNQDAFYAAFHVKKGDPMFLSPDMRTHLW